MSIEHWLLDRLPERGRLALDIGANVGSYTTWLANRFDAVHAFEPHPAAYQELRRRCDGNLTRSVLALAKTQGPQQLAESLVYLESLGLRGAKAMDALKAPLVLIEAAVGARDGELTLNTYAETVHTSAYEDAGLDTLSRGPAAGTLAVPMVTLDGLGYQYEPVDFVKVDVEGYEVEVLLGAKATLEATMPQLLIEIHLEANGEQCERVLDELGYKLARIAHPHAGVPAGHHWLAADRPGAHRADD